MTDFRSREGAALLVGASGGIGAAIASSLIERGSRVAMTYRRPNPRVDELSKHNDTASFQIDLNDAAGCRGVVDAALERFGSLHTVVYAAGPHVPMRYVATIDAELFRQQMLDDAVGCFNIVQPTLPHLRKTKGNIVAVTTVATKRFPARDSLSSTPKGAVEALVRAIAFEEGRFGVRANCIGPGIMADGMTERLVGTGEFTESVMEDTRTMIPMRRLGAAADIAAAVCFLASDEAGYITGQKLDVDGGYAL